MRSRLNMLLDMAQGAVIADIGCDHGKLCQALVGRGHRVIGTDLSAPSLAKAKRRMSGVCAFEARLGDGFAPLNEGEFDCAILAGMGAATMCGILERAGEKAKGPLLILQPMNDVAGLRAYLRENGFGLIQEEMVREDRRFYPILAARYGAPILDDPEWMDEAGPLLMRARHPLMQEYLAWRLQVYGKAQAEWANRVKEAIKWLAQ